MEHIRDPRKPESSLCEEATQEFVLDPADADCNLCRQVLRGLRSSAPEVYAAAAEYRLMDEPQQATELPPLPPEPPPEPEVTTKGRGKGRRAKGEESTRQPTEEEIAEVWDGDDDSTETVVDRSPRPVEPAIPVSALFLEPEIRAMLRGSAFALTVHRELALAIGSTALEDAVEHLANAGRALNVIRQQLVLYREADERLASLLPAPESKVELARESAPESAAVVEGPAAA